jgi:hypothetical protein
VEPRGAHGSASPDVGNTAKQSAGAHGVIFVAGGRAGELVGWRLTFGPHGQRMVPGVVGPRGGYQPVAPDEGNTANASKQAQDLS